MPPVHIDIQHIIHGNLKQEIDPWAVQQTSDIDEDCPAVESQEICVGHQRPAAGQEAFLYLLWHSVNAAILFLQGGMKLLESRGPALLAPFSRSAMACSRA